MARYVTDNGLSAAIYGGYSLAALEATGAQSQRQGLIDDQMSMMMTELGNISQRQAQYQAIRERSDELLSAMGSMVEHSPAGPILFGLDIANKAITPSPEHLQGVADDAAAHSRAVLLETARGVAHNVGAEDTLAFLQSEGAAGDPDLADLLDELAQSEVSGPQGPGSDGIRDLRRMASEASSADELRVLQEQLKDEEAGFGAVKETEFEALRGVLTEHRTRAATARGDENAAEYRYSRGQNMLLTFMRAPGDMVISGAEWFDIGLASLFEFAFEPNVWEGTGLSPETTERYRVLKGGTDILREALYAMLPPDDARAQDFSTDLAQAAGSLVAFYAAGAAGVPVWAAGGTVAGTAQYNDARLHHAAAGQKFIAFLLGSGIGTSEAVPISRVFNRMRVDYGTDKFTALLANTAAGSFEEFTQEFFQAAGEDLAAKYGFFGFTQAYDADRSLKFSDWLYQGGLGAITGAVPSAVATMVTPQSAFQPPDPAEFEKVAQAAKAELDRIMSEAATMPALDASVAPTIAVAPPVPGRDGTTDAAVFAAAGDAAVEGAVEIPNPAVDFEGAVGAVTKLVQDNPAFVEWFGDSTVTDENGGPLVVYHGTQNDFTVFSEDPALAQGFYFTADAELASAYVSGFYGPPAAGENIIPAYLSAQHTADFTNKENINEIVSELFAADKNGDVWYEVETTEVADVWRAFHEGRRDMIESLQEAGFDSAKIVEPDTGDETFIVFSPEQVKSVFNRGAFDADDPDILAAVAPAVSLPPAPPPPAPAPAEAQRFDIMYEAVGGEGSASADTFGERYANLSPEQQDYVTRRVTDLAWQLATDTIPAISVVPAYHGVGAWEMHRNASTIGGVLASDWESAKLTSMALGWMLGQTEVMATRIKPLTAAAKPTAISVELFAPQATRSQLDDVFTALSEASPKVPDGDGGEMPSIVGYTTVLRNDGTEAIRVIVTGPSDATPAENRKLVRRVRDFMEADETSALIDGVLPDVEADVADAELYRATNQWDSSDYEKRTAYASEYRKITGRHIFSDFRGAERQVRAETALAIHVAETGGPQSGSAGRAAALAEYAGPQPFADADGQVNLTHWSDESRPVLDPAFAGTDPLIDENRKNGVRRLFFGVGVGQPGGYGKEALGAFRHETSVAQGELYNLAADELGLFAATDKDTTDAARWDEVIDMARSLGFRGAWNPNHAPGATAILFEPVNAETITNDETGEEVYKRGEPDLEAAVAATGSSVSRGPLTGEPTRDPQGVPETPELADQAPTALREVANAFIKLMGLTANQGRFTLKGREIMGQYQRSQGTIRLREWDDVSTLFHEAGHALHDKMDGPLRDVVRGNRSEVLWSAEHIYLGDMTGKDESTKVREGFAELFRLFVQDRAQARDYAPGWTQAMEDLLATEAPTLLDGLGRVGEMYNAYINQSSLNLARSMVVPQPTRSLIGDTMDSIAYRGFKETGAIAIRETVRQGIDKFMPLRTLTARMLNLSEERGALVDLKVSDDPAKLAQLARNSSGRSMMHMLHGVTDYHSFDKMSASLQDALYLSQGVAVDGNLGHIDAERQHDFATYVASLRALDEYGRYEKRLIERPPVNATKGDMQQAVADMEAKYGPSFVEAAKVMNDYARALWKRQFHAGLITKEAYIKGNERTFYVPLLRDMSDRNDAVGLATGSISKGAKNLLHTFRGSNRQIIDPMQALMHKTIALEAAIARNDTVKALANLADDTGVAGALVERIPTNDMTATTLGVTEIMKQLTGLDNMSEEDASDLLTILQPHMDQNAYLQIFRAAVTSTRGEPVTFYWDDGQMKAIQINDSEVASDVVNLFDGIGQENQTMGAEVLSLTSNIFRAGITSWPDFILVNFIRDQLSAWIATDVKFKPFVSGAGGVADELMQRDWARKYNVASGVMGGVGTAQFDAARVDKDLATLRGKGYKALVFQPGARGFLKGITRLTEFSETGTRLGLFKAGWARAKADGLNDWEAGIEASFMGTDYMDFGLHGDRTLLVRRSIPFLSAQINGLYKFTRTLGNSEVARRKGLMFALSSYFKSVDGQPLTRAEKISTVTGRKAWIKMSSLGLLSAALAFAFRDDEDFQETSEYLRATGWVMPMGDGRIVYIPKPFEWAMVANIIERGIETAYGDDRARERMTHGILEQLMPPLSNPAWEALNEYRTNYDKFRGSEILPSYMQAAASVDAQTAVTAYTSQLAKDIGAVTGWKPIWVDHFIQNMGASMARDTSLAYEMARNPSVNVSSISVTDAPILRRFFRDASRGATATQDMWRLMSARDGELTGAAAAYKAALQSGVPDKAQRLLSSLPAEQRTFAVLDEHFTAAEKRLHPVRRARDIGRVISAMRRELRSDMGLGFTRTGDLLQTVPLTARQRTRIGEELQDYATREARNALIFIGEEGWAHRPPSDLRMSLNAIREISPQVAEELAFRMAKARVYDGGLVRKLWPEARRRLEQNGEAAYLDDLSGMGEDSL